MAGLMAHARGPAKVPPEKDWPPREWGTTLPWGVRVAAWRKRPAKERRSCSLPRHLHSPEMLDVGQTPFFGSIRTIKWSDGHGIWDTGRNSRTLKRGYWAQGPRHSAPVFIGESIEDVTSVLRKQADSAIHKVEGHLLELQDKVHAFDRVNRMKILDHIVADLDAPRSP